MSSFAKFFTPSFGTHIRLTNNCVVTPDEIWNCALLVHMYDSCLVSVISYLHVALVFCAGVFPSSAYHIAQFVCCDLARNRLTREISVLLGSNLFHPASEFLHTID